MVIKVLVCRIICIDVVLACVHVSGDAQSRVRAQRAMLAPQPDNRCVERMWRPATSALRALTAWEMPRNRRRASSARSPPAATVLLVRRPPRARRALLAAPALARRRTQVRLRVCKVCWFGEFCLVIMCLAHHCIDVVLCVDASGDAQSRAPAQPGTLVL